MTLVDMFQTLAYAGPMAALAGVVCGLARAEAHDRHQEDRRP